jgi:glycogen operon protein
LSGDPRKQKCLGFCRSCSRILREQPVLQRRKFFQGRALRGSGIADISFFEPGGYEMTDEHWNAGFIKCLGMRLAGDLINDVDDRGEPILGDTLLLLLNAHWEEIPFELPTTIDEQLWETLIDTRDDEMPQRICRGGEKFPLYGRSLALLRTVPKDYAGQGLTPLQIRALRQDASRTPAAPSPTTGPLAH